MEATGSDHLPLAIALHAAGHTVLVCNPLSIARYSEAVLARTKTDATDARRIARFCEAHAVAPWTPAPPAQQHLHALLATRETLVHERLRLSNRQHAAGYTASQALVTDPCWPPSRPRSLTSIANWPSWLLPRPILVHSYGW
jgi:transposase